MNEFVKMLLFFYVEVFTAHPCLPLISKRNAKVSLSQLIAQADEM
jgi:hypothetical protein